MDDGLSGGKIVGLYIRRYSFRIQYSELVMPNLASGAYSDGGASEGRNAEKGAQPTLLAMSVDKNDPGSPVFLHLSAPSVRRVLPKFIQA